MQSSLPLNAFADIVVQLQAIEAPRTRGLRAIYGSAAVAAEDGRGSVGHPGRGRDGHRNVHIHVHGRHLCGSWTFRWYARVRFIVPVTAVLARGKEDNALLGRCGVFALSLVRVYM